MPALDSCHSQVVRALEKEGWEVDPQPYKLTFRRRPPLMVDIFAIQGDRRAIIVEVKCFSTNPLNDLYVAVGQYLVYRSLLRARNIEHPLYLAVPDTIYETLFKEIGMFVVEETQIKLIVVDMKREVIIKWLTQ